MAVLTTHAIVLRTSPYGDTSQIVQVLTHDHGRIGLVARGTRKRPGGPAPFQRGALTFNHRDGRDLQNLREFTADRMRSGLARPLLRFYGAGTLVELILRTSAGQTSDAVFRTLDLALDRLEHADPAALWPATLSGCWALVRELGYGPGLDACHDCGRAAEDEQEVMRFDLPAGALRCAHCAGPAGPRVGPGARAQLHVMLAGETDLALDTRHVGPHLRLLGDFVTYHVTGDPALRSLGSLAAFLP